MPNLDFYAVAEDFPPLLDFVFRRGCRVFESYSPPGEQLMEFTSLSELEKWHRIGTERLVLLQVVVPGAFELCRIRRIDLQPNGSRERNFRHVIEGWGLIQLYLGGIGDWGLESSHSNHNSVAHSKNWEQTLQHKMGPVDAWDWREVYRISSALNRFIQKLAVYKLGSRPVLLGAATAFERCIEPAMVYDQRLLREYQRRGV